MKYTAYRNKVVTTLALIPSVGIYMSVNLRLNGLEPITNTK